MARGRAVAELPAEPAAPTHLQVAVPDNSGRPPLKVSHVSWGNPSTAPPSTRPWESATHWETEGWVKASTYRSGAQGVAMGIGHALFVTNCVTMTETNQCPKAFHFLKDGANGF